MTSREKKINDLRFAYLARLGEIGTLISSMEVGASDEVLKVLQQIEVVLRKPIYPLTLSCIRKLLTPYIQDGKLRDIPIEKKRELVLKCYRICPCGICEYVETGKDCWNFNGCLETIWEFLNDISI